MQLPSLAAGALYSTVGDRLLWDQALYGERLLPARLRDLLFKTSPAPFTAHCFVDYPAIFRKIASGFVRTVDPSS